MLKVNNERKCDGFVRFSGKYIIFFHSIMKQMLLSDTKQTHYFLFVLFLGTKRKMRKLEACQVLTCKYGDGKEQEEAGQSSSLHSRVLRETEHESERR